MPLPVLVLVALGATLFLAGWRRRTPIKEQAAPMLRTSPIHTQHLHLLEGGQLNPDAIELTKCHFREQLDAGEIQKISNAFRPGLDYVICVRALAELGTEEAGEVLEKQLDRRLSDDPLEQNWYWIDVAQGLRELNRYESLPRLLQCAEASLNAPLIHLFAAEIVCFPGFSDYLDHPLSTQGQSALRVFHKALQGIRTGYVPLHVYADAQLGESVTRLVRACPDVADPLVARVFLEILRNRRRSDHMSIELQEHPSRRKAVRWQSSCIKEAEPIIREYLHGIGEDLARALPYVQMQDQNEILAALQDLRTDAGSVLLPMIAHQSFPFRSEAFTCLAWSKHPSVPSSLYYWEKTIGTSLRRRFPWFGSLNAQDRSTKINELRAILFALRGHPSEQSERILLQYIHSKELDLRRMAIQSLGWWEPVRRTEVLLALRTARFDAHPEIRKTSLASLARLGERNALQEFREALLGTDTVTIHETIERIANEGLTWLWVDLDQLTETEDLSIAAHACEALERLREDFLGPLV